MNNIKWILENKEQAKIALTARGSDPNDIDNLLKEYRTYADLKQRIEKLYSEKNLLTKEIKGAKEKKPLLEKVKEIAIKIAKPEEHVKNAEVKYLKTMLSLPNLNIRNLEDKNLWTKPKEISRDSLKKDLPTTPHWEIYKELNLVSFDWGVKVGGTRFITYVGKGAKLRRAIIDYQIDNATKEGYLEVLPPVIASHLSLQNSGHFPKFKEDVFCIEGRNLALVGTAETAICNFFSKDIVQTSTLPQRFSATSLNFRSESGSAGKDTRGAIRMHQFTKTELFVFCEKKEEDKEFKKMLNTAERLLKDLDLPYLVKQLPLNDLGFSATVTYDLEVWMPSSNDFREVSSVSIVGDFQSRRGKIRHRETNKESTQFCSTLNGTAIAVDRIMAAICENNYDSKTKTIKIPKALHKYYGDSIIST